MNFKLLLCALVALCITATTVYGFDIDVAKGTVSASYYRVNENRYENRLNIVPRFDITNTPFFYWGDHIINFSATSPSLTRDQYKNLLGAKIYKGLSVRYQNDQYDDNKLVKGKIKPVVWNENRYGLGYKLDNTIYGTRLSNDLMVLKGDIADFRTELNTVIDNKYLSIKNQVWYDFTDGDVSKWLVKTIVGYKVTDWFQVQWRSEWKPTPAARLNMVGIGVNF